MPFKNRNEAAKILAERLAHYKGLNPLVLAIPRGAVPMGKIIADSLGGDLDVVLVRKLGAPFQPELAIGSVDETGRIYLDPRSRTLATDTYIASEKEAQLKILRERRALYSPAHPPIYPAGRIVIVVDNGVATGATMIAALRAVRAKRPKKTYRGDGCGSSGELGRHPGAGRRDHLLGGSGGLLRGGPVF
jgi:predicted phosphoribosyltransferase